MKKTVLKALAKLVEFNINQSNRTTCLGWTYQPKAPKDIRGFKK